MWDLTTIKVMNERAAERELADRRRIIEKADEARRSTTEEKHK